MSGAGLSAAVAAQQVIANTLAEDTNQRLDQLAAHLEHITLKPAEWREAVAYLAAQLYSARRISDAARARDAASTLAAITQHVESFNTRHNKGDK